MSNLYIWSMGTMRSFLFSAVILAVVAIAAVPAIAAEIDAEDGIVTPSSFLELMRESPDSVYWIDVRGDKEAASDGTFADAMVINIADLEEKMDDLPNDRPLIFFCASGFRASEAWDFVTMWRDDVDAYFLDARLTFNQNPYPTITVEE